MSAQPSTLPKVKEQHTTTVTVVVATVDSVVADCMQLFEQSFEVLTTLQEDLNVDHLETEAHKIQKRCDEAKGTAQIVSLTQRLARMQEEKVVKEQVDSAQHKEAVLKVCL